MICVADSGSSKTDWVLVESQEDQSTSMLESLGLNPFVLSPAEMIKEINRVLHEDTRNRVEELFFYGSGCSDELRKSQVYEALTSSFGNANIAVEHDLLGAARSVCGKDAGIVGILGTGSSTCYFNGEEITYRIPALGWALGDEGAGMSIGASLLRSKYYGELPVDLNEEFDTEFQKDLSDILTGIYQEGLPNRFIASFARFCGERKSHPFIASLLKREFDVFVDRLISKYASRSQSVYLIGSIAYHYQDVLAASLKDKGFSLTRVLKKPIDGLVAFHAS